MQMQHIDKITSKAEARQQAIDWQASWQDYQYSYSELIEWQSYFTQLAEKFNLKEEFEENGII